MEVCVNDKTDNYDKILNTLIALLEEIHIKQNKYNNCYRIQIMFRYVRTRHNSCLCIVYHQTILFFCGYRTLPIVRCLSPLPVIWYEVL